MKNYPKVSLCISTYNWPQALELCLKSVQLQTYKPDEIIIGDDGSKEDTKKVIDKLKQKFSIPVIHIWHADEGFRLAQIRNKSFAAATGDYIIQIDGDLVLNKYFIEDHLKFAKKNKFIAGARSLLTPGSTTKIFMEKKLENVPQNYALKKRYNAFRSGAAALINFHLTKGISQTKYVLGANMSFWKKDLITINGYNEDFKGWGKEDNDLAVRLCNAGINLHSLKFAGIVYHLNHKEAPRESYLQNKILLQNALEQKQTYVVNGLDKYLN